MTRDLGHGFWVKAHLSVYNRLFKVFLKISANTSLFLAFSLFLPPPPCFSTQKANNNLATDELFYFFLNVDGSIENGHAEAFGLALLLNTPLVASDLVLLASLAIPRNQPGTDSCTRLSDLQCRFYPQDQVALLQRTPTISRKRLKLYSRSPPFFFLMSFVGF